MKKKDFGEGEFQSGKAPSDSQPGLFSTDFRETEQLPNKDEVVVGKLEDRKKSKERRIEEGSQPR